MCPKFEPTPPPVAIRAQDEFFFFLHAEEYAGESHGLKYARMHC